MKKTILLLALVLLPLCGCIGPDSYADPHGILSLKRNSGYFILENRNYYDWSDVSMEVNGTHWYDLGTVRERGERTVDRILFQNRISGMSDLDLSGYGTVRVKVTGKTPDGESFVMSFTFS